MILAECERSQKRRCDTQMSVSKKVKVEKDEKSDDEVAELMKFRFSNI
jgi:hypothetical protein